jgi:hypothetical protein
MISSSGNQLGLFLLARTLEFVASREDDLEYRAQKLTEARALRKQALLSGAVQGKPPTALERS